MRGVFVALALMVFSIGNAVAAGRVVSVQVSPDQQHIAMIVSKQGGVSLLLSKAGSTPLALFHSTAIGMPHWSSDSQRVAWIDYHASNRQACVYQLGAKHPYCQDFTGWHLLSLRWRPNTDQMALLARLMNHNPNMPNQVLLWRVGDKKPQVLTHADQNITAMSWSADGNILVLQNHTNALPRFWQYQWPQKTLKPVILPRGQIGDPVFSHKDDLLAYTISTKHGKLICTVVLGTGHHACANNGFDLRSQLLGWTSDNRLLVQQYQDIRSGLITLSVPGFELSELHLSPVPQQPVLNASGTAVGYIDMQGQAHRVNLRTQQSQQVRLP